MIEYRCLTKNKGRLRKTVVDGIEFRTCDKRVNFDDEWAFRNQMMEICDYMGVRIVWLRSDHFTAYAETISVTVNPPTTESRLLAIAHEAAHVGFRHTAIRMSRHRQEFETGTFEAQYLRYYGIEPTAKQLKQGTFYVADLIRMAIRRGVTRFDRESWAYARSTVLPQWIGNCLDSLRPTFTDQSQDNGYREAMAHFGRDSSPAEHVLDPFSKAG